MHVSFRSSFFVVLASRRRDLVNVCVLGLYSQCISSHVKPFFLNNNLYYSLDTGYIGNFDRVCLACLCVSASPLDIVMDEEGEE